ncbi:glycoside hydrolase family 26 protein [Desulfosarcina sp.]|uniref:glycoside hydrolase family 26 protein n=1 Tax=Desulfosarcina sp. TaxID=2027861 RepID=UPI003568BEA3
MKLGIYRLHEILDADGLSVAEKAIGRTINLISVYRAWNDCNIEADRPWLERLKGSRRDILLTWEPWRLPLVNNRSWEQPDFSLSQVLSGRYDDYIMNFAQTLAGFPQTIYLRPMHEMNGNWYPWCGCVNHNRVSQFVPVWHYLRNLVGRYAFSDLQWVWSPYATSYPHTDDNAMRHYFPGDDAVDWVALDGYNWGTTRPEVGWQSFDRIFREAYQSLTALSHRPIMIAETACSEMGGDKAEWIEHAFHGLKNRFARIKLMVWFDADKECDWRIDSSLRAFNAFRKAVSRSNR